MRKMRMITVLSLITALCLFCTACGQSDAPEEAEVTNLFEYAVTITDGIFSPANVEFLMSEKEVTKARPLNSSQISKDEQKDRIISMVKIAGLSGEAKEIYNFEDDKLVSVMYLLPVEKSEQNAICNTLYEQALSRMPEPDTANMEENIKNGKNTVMWMDETGNSVSLSFPETKKGEPQAIILQISVTHDLEK